MRSSVIIGNVVIPNDVDRDAYVKYSLRTQTVCVLTQRGDFMKNCPVASNFLGVDQGWLNAMEYPENEFELGTQVVCLNLKGHNIPVVVGCLRKRNATLQLDEEHQFKLYRKFSSGDDNHQCYIEGRGLKGILNLVVDSSDDTGGKINIESTNKGEKGEINLNTDFLKLYGAKEVLLLSNEFIGISVQNYADENFEPEIVIESKNGTIRFNDGDNGSFIIIQNLVDQLNAAENKINDLISKYNNHTHLVPQTPTGATTSNPILPPSQEQSISNTSVSDIENDKITH